MYIILMQQKRQKDLLYPPSYEKGNSYSNFIKKAQRWISYGRCETVRLSVHVQTIQISLYIIFNKV